MVDVQSRALPWVAAGASVRGVSHHREGRPNQDALAHWRPASGAHYPVIVAVADGHGGSRHFRSATGARIAVDVTIQVLREAASRLDLAGDAQCAQIAAVEIPRRIVAAWTDNARRHLDLTPIGAGDLQTVEAAEGAPGVESVRADPLIAYGATLLAALVTERCIVLLQLGDGDILVVGADGATHRPLPADERLVGNLTTSICRPGAESDFRAVVLRAEREAASLLLLSTDGYANSFKTDADFLQVGGDFLDMLRRDGLSAVEAQLPKILAHASTNGSGDDITLALLQNSAAVSAAADRATGDTAGHDLAPQAPEDIVAVRMRLTHAEQRIGRLKLALGAACVVAVAAIGYTVRLQTHQGAGLSPPPAAKPLLHKESDGGSGAPEGKKPAGVPDPAPAQTPLARTQPPEGAIAATPLHPVVEEVHANRTEKGVAVSAVLVPMGAGPGACSAEATVWDAKDQKLGSAPMATGANDPDPPTVPIQGLVHYPKDERHSQAMKAKDAKVSVAVSCGGRTITETKKQAITG